MGANDGLQSIVTIPHALSPEQCADLAERIEREPLSSGKVTRGSSTFRDCEIAWIKPDETHVWLYDIVCGLFERASTSLAISVGGLLDPLQYTVYERKQHYQWHMDIGPGLASLRKISLSLQLSDPRDFTGGALEFAHAPGWRSNQEQGCATLFPAFMSHRVTPVFRGVRRSLVAWGCGEAFR
jgi:PKHD-type hydroxylase